MIMKIIDWIIGVMTALLVFMFGNVEQTIAWLWILILFMVIDILTGIISSINSNYDDCYNRKKLPSTFKWSAIRIGVSKKIMTLFVIAMAYQIDKMGIVSNAINLEMVTISIFIGYEAVSILNNVKIQGVKIPKILYDAILKLVERDKDGQ